MTSFNYAITPTCGNWFQTNQPEQESDDCAGDTVTSVGVTNEEDLALQWQIWSTFCRCSKTKITDRTGTLVLVRVSWDMISKIYWQFWHSFFKNALESGYNFNPIEIMWRKMIHSICLTPVSMATWHLHTLWRFTVSAYTSAAKWCVHTPDTSVILPTESRQSHAQVKYTGVHNNNLHLMPTLSTFLWVCTNTRLTDAVSASLTFKHAGVLCLGVRSPWSRRQNTACVCSVFSLI